MFSRKIWIIISTTILLFTISISFVPEIIEIQIQQQFNSLSETTGFTIQTNNIELRNINNIYIKKIAIKQPTRNNSASLTDVDIHFNPIDYLLNTPFITNISILKGQIDIDKKNATNNLTSPDTTLAYKKTRISFNHILTKVSKYIPTNLNIDSFKIKLFDKQIEASNIYKDKTKLSARLRIKTTEETNIMFLGNITSHDCEYKLTPIHKKNIKMGWKTNSESFISVDSLNGSINFTDIEDNQLSQEIQFYNLSSYHHYISDDTITVSNISCNTDIKFGRNCISIDSTSTLTINGFEVYPTLTFLHDTSSQINFKLQIPQQNLQNIVNAIPTDLLNNLKGIQLSGNLSGNVSFFVDFNKIDSLMLNCRLTPINMSIEQMGKTDLGILESNFTHKVKLDSDKTIFISTADTSPNYATLDTISDTLQFAILQAEDGIFFSHKGFIAEAFRYALIQNIKAGRFVRGGSTITMQLVKNIFLNQKKNLSRKIEEAIIVWLIEELKLCSKERMFELYLNIIEWGPNIYGVTQAANFYFSKHPSQLNLSESVFLASVIPSPQKFMYRFDKNGTLHQYYRDYFSTLTNNMVRCGQIKCSDTIHRFPIEKLTGKAKEYINPTK